MIVATAAASISLFLVAFWLLRVLPVSASALAVARGALDTIRDTAIDDFARQKAVQRASLQMFGILVSILGRGAAAVGASLLPIWLADVTDLAASDQVIAFLLRWDVIVSTLVVFVLLYYARTRLWPPH